MPQESNHTSSGRGIPSDSDFWENALKQAAFATLIGLVAISASAHDTAGDGAFLACLRTYNAGSISKADLSAANFACTCLVREVRARSDSSEFAYFEELEKLMASNIQGVQLSNELAHFSGAMGDSPDSGNLKFRRVRHSIDLALEVCRSKS